ncbi:unnamed protein product [Cuscuta epithymum]|uniref:Secreted protein n=1 Tax=Cuscuta epithymum TaxID=186058 RepID=A0AAV0GHP2_9ASTE|nr:unnamed protein product [Cuscuta epithymum]
MMKAALYVIVLILVHSLAIDIGGGDGNPYGAVKARPTEEEVVAAVTVDPSSHREEGYEQSSRVIPGTWYQSPQPLGTRRQDAPAYAAPPPFSYVTTASELDPPRPPRRLLL